LLSHLLFKIRRGITLLVIVNPSILSFLAPWAIWKGSRDSKGVFLTFDDGPDPAYTAPILQILAEGKIPAAFFLTGHKAALHPGLVREIGRHGHTVGNHGFSHLPMAFKKKGWICQEIARTHAAISSAIDGACAPRLFRPPYGRFDPRFRRILEGMGYRMVLWSLLSKDFLENSAEQLIRRMDDHLHPGAIIVFHDGHNHGPVLIEALPRILRRIRDRGFQFLNLADHPGGTQGPVG